MMQHKTYTDINSPTWHFIFSSFSYPRPPHCFTMSSGMLVFVLRLGSLAAGTIAAPRDDSVGSVSPHTPLLLRELRRAVSDPSSIRLDPEGEESLSSSS